MSRKRPRRSLYPLLILVWLLALLLAGGLAGMLWLHVSAPPGAAGESGQIQPTSALRTLPPTWTPSPPTPTRTPADTGPPSGGSIFEPTATPQFAFPTAPAVVFTPMSFFDGPIVFGETPGGRSLEAYRFGTGAVQRMIVAGIHGGYEWNSTHLAEELIAYLQEHPDRVPRNVTLFIIPSLNPDGYARSKGFDGRVNENGVDLNRNFPVNWLADWERGPCWNYAPTSSGDGPGSEPETQALMAFIDEETRVTALISYHSAALGVFPGGDPPDEESVRLAHALAAVSTYAYPPVDTGCFYSGTLADWAASRGIAAVDLELHTHYFTDFEENLDVLDAFLAWRR